MAQKCAYTSNASPQPLGEPELLAAGADEDEAATALEEDCAVAKPATARTTAAEICILLGLFSRSSVGLYFVRWQATEAAVVCVLSECMKANVCITAEEESA